MNCEPTIGWALRALFVVTVSALLCAALIMVLRPLLARYAVALPNARSSHKVPTSQGGGIAVMTATLAVAYAALVFERSAVTNSLLIVAGAIVFIALVGVLADFHPENIASRLLLQALAVAIVIYALPESLRTLPLLPWWLERTMLLVGALWLVNVVNFMDGLDWLTVAEVVPVTAALAAIGILGVLPPQTVIVSLALCGAIIGFAIFNRPVARLFLGDVGSLPIGLGLGWLLILLAGHGGRTAAILLPLYYLGDSTITLVRRAFNGERVWRAHRSHFYQHATDRGFTVIEIIGRVFAVNLVLAALAVTTVILHSRAADTAALLAGAALVGWLLYTFTRGRS